MLLALPQGEVSDARFQAVGGPKGDKRLLSRELEKGDSQRQHHFISDKASPTQITAGHGC